MFDLSSRTLPGSAGSETDLVGGDATTALLVDP